MNYPETIEFLYSQLPMFSKIGSDAIKKGLDNIINLCDSLDNPQHKFKTIHIAGTNGKGSVSHMLAAILQTAGYKTSLYTSPHLIDFRERIKLNGEMIPAEDVVGFVEKIIPKITELHPSFFEITVAMAFDYFAANKVDIAIIETGLGGRLDSTNIIKPILSVITNIAYDHTDLLGNTLELIAAEKAGIIKKNTPVVIGEVIPETKDVFNQKATLEFSDIFYAEEEWKYCGHKINSEHLSITVENQLTGNISDYKLDLRGSYQIHNIITVLSAISQLKLNGWDINDEALNKGLMNVTNITGLKGRWDIVNNNPLIVIDVGHNAHGVSEVLKQIQTITYKNLHFVTGMVKDKDVDSVLNLLPVNATYYFTKAQIPRALQEDLLHERASKYNLSGYAYPSVNLAIESVIKNADKDDLIVICGSVFVAGEAYQYFLSNK